MSRASREKGKDHQAMQRKLNAQRPSYRIHKNVWDNWYGYEGTRRVAAFANTPYATAEQNAKAWLRSKTEGPHRHTCPVCGETLTCNNPTCTLPAGSKALCGACPDETNADMWKRSNS